MKLHAQLIHSPSPFTPKGTKRQHPQLSPPLQKKHALLRPRAHQHNDTAPSGNRASRVRVSLPAPQTYKEKHYSKHNTHTGTRFKSVFCDFNVFLVLFGCFFMLFYVVLYKSWPNPNSTLYNPNSHPRLPQSTTTVKATVTAGTIWILRIHQLSARARGSM